VIEEDNKKVKQEDEEEGEVCKKQSENKVRIDV